MIVVESGRERLGRWIDYERDLAADLEPEIGPRRGAEVKG